MKFIALVSGGKDSIYATLQAIENGHELVCCAHLAPSSASSAHNLDDESYMYQTAGSEAVRVQVEECMGVPFYVREIHGRSKNTALVYDNNSDEEDGSSSDDDEVEDLYLLLNEIQSKHREISAVSSGAILSTYQRTRIEHVCSRLNLISLSYLWRMSSQRTLLDSILDDGEIDAVLVRVACPPGLIPHRHLGKSLRELRDRGVLDQLNDRYGMNPAGEGGEYETLVLDCPKLFKLGRLVLEETEVVCDESDDGVGILKILKCSVMRKNLTMDQLNATTEFGLECIQRNATELVRKARSGLPPDVAPSLSIPPEVSNQIHQSLNLPNVRVMKGGLCHISALLSPIASNQVEDESLAAVQEFLVIQQMLQTVLSGLFTGDEPPTSPQDILYVHLYLSEMLHFVKINQYYRQFFGTHLPPSRACVAVGKGALPGGRRVMMDCIIQRGSGAYLRQGSSADACDKYDTYIKKELQNKHSFLRKTLHVQSISNWAPVCIGPYSQANSLRSSLVFLAGMIGLVPQNMTLIKPTSSDVSSFEVQLYQSWRNAAAVLDGLEEGGGKLDDCFGGLVYVSIGALESLLASSTEDDEEVTFSWRRLWKTAHSISNHALSTNAGFVMGSIDGIAANNPRSTTADPNLYDEDGALYGGYEDEETWREMTGATIPLSSPPKTSDDSGLPLLMVCLPELPANADAEVELILASRRAASCLDVFTGSLASSSVQYSDRDTSTLDLNQGILWDTGNDHTNPHASMEQLTSCVKISSIARFVGRGCACMSTVIAKLIPCNNSLALGVNTCCFDLNDVLSRMIDASINNAKGENEMSSLFTIDEVLNVRLYYISASVSRRKVKSSEGNDSPSFEIDMKDDGSSLRIQLHSVLQLKSKQYHDNANVHRKCRSVSVPAYTVVPVLGMQLSCEKDCGTPMMAMQVTLADMTRMETEIWVRHNRQYEYDK